MLATPALSSALQRLCRFLCLFACLCATSCLVTGCGAVALSLADQALVLTPSAATLQVGQKLSINLSGSTPAAPCSWSSSNPALLPSIGRGQFLANAPGRATVTVQCGSLKATSSIIVGSLASGPLVITHGGTYSGTWNSNDPSVPAVLIQTSDPVTIQNSIITGRGDLISVSPSRSLAGLTVQDVTGIAYDPQIAGMQRGSFLTAENTAALIVKHCSMYGVRFGIKLLSSVTSPLVITGNLARNLEDRESDGHGGFLDNRPDLGHFIMLNRVSAPRGAEIAWNTFHNTLGVNSTEDIINIYKSQGSPLAAITVHDNFLEGNGSPASPANYTGAGLITDGDALAPETAFVTFSHNQIVHTAGSGIEVASGHHIQVSENRIVSCGKTRSGTWYAAPFVNAIDVWNFYAAPEFSNITVQNNNGGMLRPDSTGNPQVADLWAATADLNSTDILTPNTFSDPCLVPSAPGQGPEAAERAFWKAKVVQNQELIGDQHIP